MARECHPNDLKNFDSLGVLEEGISHLDRPSLLWELLPHHRYRIVQAVPSFHLYQISHLFVRAAAMSHRASTPPPSYGTISKAPTSQHALRLEPENNNDDRMRVGQPSSSRPPMCAEPEPRITIPHGTSTLEVVNRCPYCSQKSIRHLNIELPRDEEECSCACFPTGEDSARTRCFKIFLLLVWAVLIVLAILAIVAIS